jgi:lipopolysaccharide/colanic/teichoic acid biosynthesis glycosyltransferase
MTLHYRILPDITGVDLGPVFPLADPLPRGRRIAADPLRIPAPRPVYEAIGKRVLDVVLASLALVLSLPVLGLLMLALWIEGGKPVFVQRRLGRDGRVFRMFKLRTMVLDAESRLATCLASDPLLRAEWDRTQKLKSDPRITPLGRLLRKTSLDELPQLINVIRGDMSLVGPRPMLPEQLPLYRTPASYLRLRPGLTGLWQVTARNEESFDLRAEIDHRYAQKVSMSRDLGIMAVTFGALWRATGY